MKKLMNNGRRRKWRNICNEIVSENKTESIENTEGEKRRNAKLKYKAQKRLQKEKQSKKQKIKPENENIEERNVWNEIGRKSEEKIIC